jgi:hypothetical protein
MVIIMIFFILGYVFYLTKVTKYKNLKVIQMATRPVRFDRFLSKDNAEGHNA